MSGFWYCPVEVTLSLISDRWKVLIIRELIYGTKRFGEILKGIGSISSKVLTEKLRAMEEDGLLIRKVYPEVPPKVEYTLTVRGFSLRSVLLSMADWGSDFTLEAEGVIPMRTKDGQLVMIMEAGKEDSEEMLELQYEAYQSDGHLLNSYDIPPLKQMPGLILKAVDEADRIVGSVRGKLMDGTLYVGKLMVYEEMQRQGIGSNLLMAIEKFRPRLRYELFTSTKSEKNVAFYEKLGYKRFKEQRVSEDLCFIYLEK